MTKNDTSGSAMSNASPVALRGEIEGKWGKLSAEEISGMKTNADLVTLVKSKYNVTQDQAQREVDAFANGRQL